MRLLYLYPEEWTGRRAREVHTLSTCVALAQVGVEVVLVVAGGLKVLQSQLRNVAGAVDVPGLQIALLSRSLGPIRSASIFSIRFRAWLKKQKRFDWSFIIHLKAAAMLKSARLPYVYEAHEIFMMTPQKSTKRQLELSLLERRVLIDATRRIATSAPLATRLRRLYIRANTFSIVPNAGQPPLPRSIGSPDGPFVYAGSIADWKGLEKVIEACRAAQVPLKIIGGTALEWQKLERRINTSGIAWRPHVPLAELPEALHGARAGLIPTNPQTPSGEYSCPMKLFDYARCGLQVITTALPSLESLDVGPWCTQVAQHKRAAWTEALKHFHYDAEQAEAARVWSGRHTWIQRAEAIKRALER